ncbi:MAG TPA: protein kinase [Myxococcota bacterium]|nr:protein kinase [Myxococcota bacterium]
MSPLTERIWRAEHEHSGRRVAVKIFRRSLRAGDLARFQREVRAIAALHHPCVVKVLDAGASPSGPYPVMEEASGTLTTVEDWDGLAEVLGDVLDGLSHAHVRGVVHRDLKPSNILRCEGRWKLADFGLAWPGVSSSAPAGTRCSRSSSSVAERLRERRLLEGSGPQ